MSNSITRNERNVLRSALATGGKLRFETHRQVGTTVKVVDGVTVVTQTGYDLQRSMQSRGWIAFVCPPHVFVLNEAGRAKAGGLRPVKGS